MTGKWVRTRTTAETELRSAIADYVAEGALDAALGLVEEFEAEWRGDRVLALLRDGGVQIESERVDPVSRRRSIFGR